MVMFDLTLSAQRDSNFTFCVTKSQFSPPKASEEVIPNEPGSYRPPAELYPYLTNVGELYEGERTLTEQLKRAQITHHIPPTASTSVTFQTTDGPSTRSTASRLTLRTLR